MRALILALLALAGAQSARAELSDMMVEREPLQMHDRVGIIPGETGQLERMEGRVRLLKMGDDVRPGEKLGSKSTVPLSGFVYQGDRVATDPESKAHFRFRDKTYIELGPDTMVGIERVRRGADRDADRKDESIFHFYRGVARVTAVSVEPWVRYYVKHAERVITVEGPADFYLEQDTKDRDLIIHVRRGKVWLISAVKGVRVDIPEGQSRQVRRDNSTKELHPLTKRELALLRERTQVRSNRM